MGLVREASDRELVQGIPVVTLSLFMLGPLPQTIKLFSTSGLPWTKTWAVIFFIAWIAEAGVRFLAGIPGTTTNASNNRELLSARRSLIRLSTWIHQAAFFIQVVIWTWIIVSFSAGSRQTFGTILASLVWGWGIGLGVWIIILVLFWSCCKGVRGGEACGFITLTIFYIGFSTLWFWVYFTSTWSYKLLFWMCDFSGPFGFLFSAALSLWGFYFFVWGCTALIIGLDFVLTSIGQHPEPSNNVEAQTLLHVSSPIEDADTESTVEAPYIASIETTAESTVAIERINQASGRSYTFPTASREGTTARRGTPTGVIATLIWTDDRWQRLDKFSEKLAKTALTYTFHWKNQNHDQNRRILAIAFALTNLLFTLLYYCFKYNPTGTIKPSWTEMLG